MKNEVTAEAGKTGSRSNADHYIVAVGASAGGLEAIHEFFDHMPQSSSFSFIVIQHLSSDYKSLLVELVAKHTYMKVFEAAHEMTIQQDCVYIIPNNKLMTVSKGRLRLADKSLVKAPNTAIDTFLYTLAADKKEKAIAIILSGTGTDGTKGIQRIKDFGGMVVVQEPATAKFDGMPNSAIASGNADFIMAPKDMHKELFLYVHEDPLTILENGRPNEFLLDEIFRLVHQQSGNDFNLYKTPTIIRRIARRMTERGFRDLSAYVGYLNSDQEEVKQLGQDFLIGVTRFFRDAQAFEILEEKILPALIAAKNEYELLKIWVCACSTGQEAYSIAILVNECLERAGKQLDVKIFATDIDEKSIEIAGQNQYPESIAKEVPQHLFQKYFIREGKTYGVIPAIRKQLVFARHDVIKSPPFIKNDLVTCRNMLIYVNSLLQEKILSTFHFSLNKGAYLFLGSSETAAGIKAGFNEISGKWKFYQKSAAINYARHPTYTGADRTPSQAGIRETGAAEIAVSTLERDFNRLITDDLGYVGVYIDKSYLIQEVVGDYRRYLSLPEHTIQLHILKMLPREVSLILNTALRKAWKENRYSKVKKIRFQKQDQELVLDISVQPPSERDGRSYTLIVFGESRMEVVPDKEEAVSSLRSDEHQHEYVFELEAELNETRTNLQMAVEEMETTNEELQSSNEELLSANEELQSSNEELQSLNEELHTLNTEHQLKIKELVELNDDLDNYFRSTDIGQVFLDAGLQIRKFNPAATSMVNLIEADTGRSIEHISTNIKSENLISDLRSVLLSGNMMEKEITLKSGSRSLMRIMPYLRQDKNTDGLVITFIDVSHITELNNILAGVFNASVNAILVFTAERNQDQLITDFKCVSFNEAAQKLLHKQTGQLTGAMLTRQLPELAEGNLFHKYSQVVEKGRYLQTEFQTSSKQWFQLVAVKMADGFAATISDISDRKAADQRLRKNYNELVHVRENLRNLNAGLEEKVRERTKELSESEERFSEVSKATNDTLWDWDLVHNTVWRSENIETMFGYGRTESYANLGFWLSKIHQDDTERVKNTIFAAINGGQKHWSAEYRLLKSDGQYAMILDRGSILHDDEGTPYRMVGSMVDITKLVDTQEKLNSSERKFRKVFDSNVIGMLFSDLHTGMISSANEAFLNMIGYTQSDLDNHEVNWPGITAPGFLAPSEAARRQILETGSCRPFEKEYVSKQGQHIAVMVGSALLDEQNPGEVVTYVIDISKEKEVEKRRSDLQHLVKKQQDEFYSIFKKAPAIIAIRRGQELKYEFVNDAFLSFYADKSQSLAYYTGKSYQQAHPELDDSELRKIEQRVLQTGETHVEKSYHVKQPVNGVPLDYWFDFIFTPVYTEQGEVDGIAFFGFDVTGLHQAQMATKELMYKKDEFMSIASHELKTPITSIKGFLQLSSRLARKTKADPQMMMYIDKANKQLENLTFLVSDLLDVSKIQAGKMQFNFSEFNAGEMLTECVQDMQNTQDYEIVLENADDITICADRHRIEQVVNNFLSNAIKYSPESRAVIISTRLSDGQLEVRVKDFGIGIPADKTGQVFDRFYRVNDTNHKFSGLGLGLYISAEIVARHGGTIGVESEENKGSVFWFRIPLERQQLQQL